MTDLFFGTSGPHDARIAIVGESWGETEDKQKRPFVGASGKNSDVGLDAALLYAGFSRDECFCTNVVSAHPTSNEMTRFFYANWQVRKGEHGPNVRGLFPKQNVIDGIDTLHKQLAAVKPDLIIGLGNYVLWALTDNNFDVTDKDGYKVPRGIGRWRGSQLYVWIDNTRCVPFLPIYHPAATFHQYPLKYLIQHDLKMRAQKLFASPPEPWDAPKRKFILRPSKAEVLATIRLLLAKAIAGPFDLSVDLETRRDQIACCGLAWTWHDICAICIPFMCTEDDSGYWTEQDEFEIIVALRKLLSHPNVRIVGQNFLYDAQYITLQWQFIPHISFDTMVAHHLCWPGTPRGLHYISSLYCYYHVYWKDEGKNWEAWMPEEQLWNYCCIDATSALEVKHVLVDLIASEGLQEQWLERVETIAMTLRMMLRGVQIDRRRRARVAMELAESIDLRQKHIESLIPPDVYPRKKKAKPWFRSPKQQMEIFYDILGIKEVKHPKTKKRTVNADALVIIAKREPLIAPILQQVEELRSLGVFYSTFTQAELDPDQRMRCSYDPAGTKTFRYSSKKNAFGRGANLENIPKGSEEEDMDMEELVT